MMELKEEPVATAQMLVRRPPRDLFEAFADPAITTRFWFTRSNGRLEPGARVRWHWDMYGVSTPVEVKEIEPDRRILISWDEENPTLVEWRFEPRGADATFVTVSNWGFAGDGDRKVARALDSTGGFNLALAGAKAFLEHGIELNLVADHAPDRLVQGAS